jgi:CheY-like chemotaxis protein
MPQVLYIDDEADILELAEIYFTERGISIQTAKDALEAFNIYEQHAFPVVVSDARMPGMNGTEVYLRLCSQYAFKGHFILVSGHYETYEKNTLPAGIAIVLTKPIDFDELIDRVIDLLKT